MRPASLMGKTSWPALGLGLLFLAGCGGPAGPPRYDVSGEVTFRGELVPAGTITFTPDAAQGNNGPQGVAEIKNGHYDTAETGRGTVGGPHRVMVFGADGVAAGEMYASGKPLFPPHTFTVDLPKETTTHDIEVPASNR